MNYSVYMFDFDYTLVDSSAGIIKSINYALKKMNQATCDDKLIKDMIGESLENIFFTISGSKQAMDFQIFREYFMECSIECMHENVSVYNDTLSTLKALKEKNKQVAIISSKDHFTIKKIAQKFNFLKYIDVIVGEDDVTNQKPAADQVVLILNKLDKSHKDALYVGDSIVDAETAYNAKVDFCAITKGKTLREQFKKFPYVGMVDNLADILFC